MHQCDHFINGVASDTTIEHLSVVMARGASQKTQNICITFVQRRPNVFDVGPALYKCYTNVSCLLGWASGHCSGRHVDHFDAETPCRRRVQSVEFLLHTQSSLSPPPPPPPQHHSVVLAVVPRSGYVKAGDRGIDPGDSGFERCPIDCQFCILISHVSWVSTHRAPPCTGQGCEQGGVVEKHFISQ